MRSLLPQGGDVSAHPCLRRFDRLVDGERVEILVGEKALFEERGPGTSAQVGAVRVIIGEVGELNRHDAVGPGDLIG